MEGAAYPPPQPGYQPPPPPGGGYYPGPQQFKPADVPPPYYGQPAPAPAPAHYPQQQSNTNVVVVNQQPSVVATTTIRPVGDHYLTLSIVLTVLCCICGTWYSLLCTVPAIIFSTMARDAESRGDDRAALSHARVSLGLNIAALVWWVVALIIIVIAIAVSVSTNRCRYYYYYNDVYDTYECNYYYNK